MNKQSEKYRKTKNLGKTHSDRTQYELQAPNVSIEQIRDTEEGDLNLSPAEYCFLVGASSREPISSRFQLDKEEKRRNQLEREGYNLY